jgi:hypothetical protein
MSKGNSKAFSKILVIQKKNFGRISESDILSRRKALRTDICVLDVLKNDFGTSIKRCL